MTMIPDWKKCPWCGGMYSRNPDVGIFACQKCLQEAKKISEAPANTLKEKLKKQQAIHRLAKYGMPRERHDLHIKRTIT